MLWINDLLREVWRDDLILTRSIPATDDPHTNRFFADGLGELSNPKDIPPSFVAVEDAGDVVATKASRRLEERKHGFIVRIATPNKALTRLLVQTYLGHLERRLSGSETDQGIVQCWTLESQREDTVGGLRLWRGQITVTVRKRRSWLAPDVVHA